MALDPIGCMYSTVLDCLYLMYICYRPYIPVYDIIQQSMGQLYTMRLIPKTAAHAMIISRPAVLLFSDVFDTFCDVYDMYP